MVKSIQALFKKKESRDRILSNVKKNIGEKGLLGLIPVRRADKRSFESDESWTLCGRPTPDEIDRSRTTNEMILSRRAVLKDGRMIKWNL
jgi:hypothetical protein